MEDKVELPPDWETRFARNCEISAQVNKVSIAEIVICPTKGSRARARLMTIMFMCMQFPHVPDKLILEKFGVKCKAKNSIYSIKKLVDRHADYLKNDLRYRSLWKEAFKLSDIPLDELLPAASLDKKNGARTEMPFIPTLSPESRKVPMGVQTEFLKEVLTALSIQEPDSQTFGNKFAPENFVERMKAIEIREHQRDNCVSTETIVKFFRMQAISANDAGKLFSFLTKSLPLQAA